VVFQFYGGVVGTRSNKAMAKWMAEEGAGDEHFNSIGWDKINLYQVSQEEVARLEKPIGVFLLTKTKHELAEEATRRGILLGYVDNMKDLLQNPQLASGFWREIEHPELNKSLTYPGFFVRSSSLECGIRRRAPLIGEHNDEIYREIGVSKEQLLSLNQAGVI
jgi:crotonobetainyl-CoA:carnitine CoA-transferase CaiB-like acyl-CoA transferase